MAFSGTLKNSYWTFVIGANKQGGILFARVRHPHEIHSQITWVSFPKFSFGVVLTNVVSLVIGL